MKLGRIVLAVTALVTLAGLAYVAQQAQPSGGSMVAAAQAFVGSLTPDQKKTANYDYDHKERTNWWFVPRQDKNRKATRNGLPLKDMTPEQKKAAIALVAAGTSSSGHKEAVTIMSLEAILHDLEKGGANVRDPEWYFFTIFGNPSKTGKWGWRVEGHHLSLNFTLDGTAVVASTPAFFGANPATVKGGDKKGLRTLAPADDVARQLFESLDESQKKLAFRAEKFREIEQTNLKPTLGAPEGIPASQLNPAQRGTLVKLLEAYTQRMPEDVAAVEMKGVKDAGLDKVHFAFTGGTKPGEKHTYRVQGPTFVIEFINDQIDGAGNPANHIHSVWRRLTGDFGIN